MWLPKLTPEHPQAAAAANPYAQRVLGVTSVNFQTRDLFAQEITSEESRIQA